MDLEERFENLPAPVPVRARKEAQWDELEAELARLTPAEVIDEEIRYVSSVSCLFLPFPASPSLVCGKLGLSAYDLCVLDSSACPTIWTRMQQRHACWRDWFLVDKNRGGRKSGEKRYYWVLIQSKVLS